MIAKKKDFPISSTAFQYQEQVYARLAWPSMSFSNINEVF